MRMLESNHKVANALFANDRSVRVPPHWSETGRMAIFFFAWIAFAVVVGVAASTRGRVGFGWFLLALAISPLIVGPLVLALPRQYAGPQTETAAARAAGSTSISLFSIFKWCGIA